MYKTIYDVVEKRGRVKTGILLNGKDAGLKYLSEEGSFFYPERAERNKEAEEFLKASVEAAVETGVVKNGDREIFVETYEKNPRLIILGGGHVSLPVAEIGRMLGFHVTVMDDREEFVTEERFPMAMRGSLEILIPCPTGSLPMKCLLCSGDTRPSGRFCLCKSDP